MQRTCSLGIFSFLALVFLVSLYPLKAYSSYRSYSPQGEWQANISEHTLIPPHMIAVDKKRQVLAIIESKKPMQMTTSYLCTTGQTPGDKVVEGDLKTPEGVYFVVRHIKSGLNFEKYGNEAYTLNYPNPVDRLRRKTGYGIWIHGKGSGIAPLQTEGCVALNNNDLKNIGSLLKPGAPVVLTSSFGLADPYEKSQKTKALETKVIEWAKRWSDRSHKLFDLYNEDAYSLSTESFKAFANNKKRLFKILPWIKIKVSDIQTLQGPGYWVTWFYQDYKAPNLSTKGIRRLYWTEKKDNNFEIIGMEWVPGLESLPILASVEEEIPPTEAPAEAISGLSEKDLRAEVDETIIAPKVEAIVQENQAAKPQVKEALKLNNDEPKDKEILDQEELMASLEKEGGAVFGAAFPAKEQEAPQSLDAPSIAQMDAEEKRRLEKEKAQKTIEDSPSCPVPKIEEQEGPMVTELSEDSAKADQDKELILQQVKDWEKAWKNADINKYMQFYSDKAMQGTRRNAQAIRKQKENLWKTNKPKTVDLRNITVRETQGLMEASMHQVYADSKGYSDKGVKTLRFKKFNNKWLITEEVWIAR